MATVSLPLTYSWEVTSALQVVRDGLVAGCATAPVLDTTAKVEALSIPARVSRTWRMLTPEGRIAEFVVLRRTRGEIWCDLPAAEPNG